MNKKISTTSIILSAIALLADTISLAQLAYEIVTTNEATDIAVRFIIIILVFFLGLGLGSIGLKGGEKDRIEKVLKVYIWAYLIMACLTYLGIVSQFRQPYTLQSYFSYVLILIIQIGAFLVLRRASNVGVTAAFPLALMTTSLIHALVLLFQFIYLKSIPDIVYVIGEMVFWLAWTLFAAPLLVQALRGNSTTRSRLR